MSSTSSTTPKDRLPAKDVAKYRTSQLKKQKGICPLCKTEILPDEAALDHDHSTGHVRMVLHRSCNSAEGRVIRWAGRNRAATPQEFLRNLLKYWAKDYTQNPEHYTHGAAKRRRSRKLKKQRRAAKGKKK